MSPGSKANIYVSFQDLSAEKYLGYLRGNKIVLDFTAPGSTATHEIAHFLGLGHSYNQMSVMFWRYDVHSLPHLRPQEVRNIIDAYSH